MSKAQKYEFRLLHEGDVWSVEIVRRVTSKKSMVSVRKTDFATATEAQDWGKAEVDMLMNKHRAKSRSLARSQKNNNVATDQE